MKRGALVVLEGLDGSGKSTQVERLVRALERAGRAVVGTREPTDGAVGRRIRSMAASAEPVEPALELRWFVEDRREHVARVIDPGLAAGHVVVCDRYFLSTVASQGARGLDPVEILEQSEAEFPTPDLAFVLELDAELGLARVRARGGAAEPVFERREFLERVAAILRSIERAYVERVDARADADRVHACVMAALRRRLDLP